MRALLAILLLATTAAAADELKDDEGVIFVRAHCGACHSLALVTAQRGDRDFWLQTIRWMQRTQNLWPLPKDQEEAILNYLAKNYDETEWGRRPPLAQSLLPDTP
jgi:hypothetical protein